MTSDQNISEASSHQDSLPVQADFAGNDGDNGSDGGQPGPGMGQSKSSRRRRRKRKNKTVGAQPGQQPGAESGGEGQPVVAVQAAAAPQPQPQHGGQQQNNNQQGGSGKRWKKKFRDRQRQQVDNPGNAFQPGNVAPGFGGGGGGGYGNGGGGGFKRKGGGGKQRKDRSFVGPMDHSYRATNGNFADTPPSTIEVHGNHGGGRSNHGPRYTGDSQPIDYSQGRSIPIPEGTPTKIYFFIEDLFFLAKIQETARKLGVKIAFSKNDKDKDVVAEFAEMDEDHRPALIVFDLNNANAKPLTLIPKLKSKLKRGTSIIGFLSHLQGDLKAKAVEAGCDTVMPRSAFSQNLPNLLRRYSAAPEEEANYNQ